MQRTFPELCAIEGRAVFTMVVSSDCIKKPKATIHNCQRVLSGRSVIYSVTVCLGLREKRSRRRSKKRYTTGVVYSVRKLAHDQTADNGDPQWLPQLRAVTARQYQRQRTKQRRQGSHHNRAKTQQTAWKIASCGVRLPCRWASSAKSTIIMAFFFTMPINSMIPIRRLG